MVGLEGAAETILTAGASNRNLLRMQRGNLLLQGVALRGADVDGAMTLPVRDPQTFWPAGGALSVGECGSIVARDVVIEDNAHYGDGAGSWQAGQGFGEHVGMVGDTLTVLDAEGLWALTPDRPGTAW